MTLESFSSFTEDSTRSSNQENPCACGQATRTVLKYSTEGASADAISDHTIAFKTQSNTENIWPRTDRHKYVLHVARRFPQGSS